MKEKLILVEKYDERGNLIYKKPKPNHEYWYEYDAKV